MGVRLMRVMRDADIREPLIEKLIRQNEGHSFRIIQEMAVCDGVSRIDIAVANGKLCGYEIKSDADTLDRLSSQSESYCKTFDKMFIVVGEKYRDVICEYIPDWWGVYVASRNKRNKIILKEQKRAKTNKNISPESLLELLWRDEIETLLRQHGLTALSGKNRRILRKLALVNISSAEIRNYTREILKKRTEWR